MVKIWNGANWINGQLIPQLYQVIINNRAYNLDEDGMVRLGSLRFRLFEHDYKGEPVGYVQKT